MQVNSTNAAMLAHLMLFLKDERFTMRKVATIAAGTEYPEATWVGFATECGFRIRTSGAGDKLIERGMTVAQALQLHTDAQSVNAGVMEPFSYVTPQQEQAERDALERVERAERDALASIRREAEDALERAERAERDALASIRREAEEARIAALPYDEDELMR